MTLKSPVDSEANVWLRVILLTAHLKWRMVAKPLKLILLLVVTTILKTFLQFTEPLCLIWLLLGIWLLRMFWYRRWEQLWMPATSWVLLTVIACTPLPSCLLANLESQTPKVQLDQIPTVDAILYLGGGVEPSFTEPTGFQLKSGADRLSTALTLAAQGKAPLLIIGGAGYLHEGQMVSEADAVSTHLKAHVPLKSEIHSLGVCSDTHDEALKVAALMKQRGFKKALLVTSASHMPRTLSVFRKVGVEVIPVPCNYLSSMNQLGDFNWFHLPGYHGFEIFKIWSHEVIGHWVYYWRGWI